MYKILLSACTFKYRFLYHSALLKISNLYNPLLFIHTLYIIHYFQFLNSAHFQRSNTSPTKIKNFGIWVRYDSRSGSHNMYREYRDVSRTGAVTQCYRDMAARHRARAHSIQIMKIESIKAGDTRRPLTKQMHDNKIEFPLPHRVLKYTKKSLFVANRPSTMQ